jgi:hypothetical protein
MNSVRKFICCFLFYKVEGQKDRNQSFKTRCLTLYLETPFAVFGLVATTSVPPKMSF